MSVKEYAVIRISTRMLAKSIAVAIVGMVGVCLLCHLSWYLGLQNRLTENLLPLLNLDTDVTIPTWFSSLLLLSVAILAVVTWRLTRQLSARRTLDHFWLVIAATFLLLSIDEVARIHETIGTKLAAKLAGKTTGLLYYNWVILGVPFAALFAAASIPFLIRLPKAIAIAFVTAGLLFLSGAVGVEMFNGKQSELHGDENIRYVLGTALEEFLEMSGVGLFLVAMVHHIQSKFGLLELRVVSRNK